MNSKHILRLAAFAAVLALAAGAACVSANEGKGCAMRAAGALNAANATIGHLDADGKCVAKAPPKAKESEGLEASAQCRDLSFSYNLRRESACAKHGGVMEWLVAQQ